MDGQDQQQQGYGQDVDAAINQTAASAGMDPAHWKAIADIESSLTPGSNYGKGTQYKGLYQIGTRGDQSEWSTHGSGDVYNPLDNATAAAKLAADNNARFKAWAGRDPTPIETYMMHQQGFGFYHDGTMSNIWGNKYPGMSGPQTPQSFEAGWARELERRAAKFGGQASPYQASIAGTSLMSGAPTSGPTRAGSRIMGAVAGPQQPGSPDQGSDATTPPANDAAAQIRALQDRYAQEEKQPAQQLQPFQFQQMMTPAMQRARMLAQIMRMRALGIDPTAGIPSS